MARLILVRHAPTPETGTKLTGRLAGVSLGPAGREVAELTAERLAAIRPAAVYTSPIARTLETAEIVAARHGLEPVLEEGIQEVDFGTWQGRSLAQLRRLKLWRQVITTPSQVRFPDGESFPEMQTRAVDACNRLAAAAGSRTIVAVSHADVIKAIVAHYLGQPLDLFQRIAIAPASVSIVHVPRQGAPMVETVNSFGVVPR